MLVRFLFLFLLSLAKLCTSSHIVPDSTDKPSKTFSSALQDLSASALRKEITDIYGEKAVREGNHAPGLIDWSLVVAQLNSIQVLRFDSTFSLNNCSLALLQIIHRRRFRSWVFESQTDKDLNSSLFVQTMKSTAPLPDSPIDFDLNGLATYMFFAQLIGKLDTPGFRELKMMHDKSICCTELSPLCDSDLNHSDPYPQLSPTSLKTSSGPSFVETGHDIPQNDFYAGTKNPLDHVSDDDCARKRLKCDDGIVCDSFTDAAIQVLNVVDKLELIKAPEDVALMDCFSSTGSQFDPSSSMALVDVFLAKFQSETRKGRTSSIGWGFLHCKFPAPYASVPPPTNLSHQKHFLGEYRRLIHRCWFFQTKEHKKCYSGLFDKYMSLAGPLPEDPNTPDLLGIQQYKLFAKELASKLQTGACKSKASITADSDQGQAKKLPVTCNTDSTNAMHFPIPNSAHRRTKRVAVETVLALRREVKDIYLSKFIRESQGCAGKINLDGLVCIQTGLRRSACFPKLDFDRCSYDELLLLKKLQYRSWVFTTVPEKELYINSFETIVCTAELLPPSVELDRFDIAGCTAYLEFARTMNKKFPDQDAFLRHHHYFLEHTGFPEACLEESVRSALLQKWHMETGMDGPICWSLAYFHGPVHFNNLPEEYFNSNVEVLVWLTRMMPRFHFFRDADELATLTWVYAKLLGEADTMPSYLNHPDPSGRAAHAEFVELIRFYRWHYLSSVESLFICLHDYLSDMQNSRSENSESIPVTTNSAGCYADGDFLDINFSSDDEQLSPTGSEAGNDTSNVDRDPIPSSPVDDLGFHVLDIYLSKFKLEFNCPSTTQIHWESLVIYTDTGCTKGLRDIQMCSFTELEMLMRQRYRSWFFVPSEMRDWMAVFTVCMQQAGPAPADFSDDDVSGRAQYNNFAMIIHNSRSGSNSSHDSTAPMTYMHTYRPFTIDQDASAHASVASAATSQKSTMLVDLSIRDSPHESDVEMDVSIPLDEDQVIIVPSHRSTLELPHVEMDLPHETVGSSDSSAGLLQSVVVVEEEQADDPLREQVLQIYLAKHQRETGMDASKFDWSLLYVELFYTDKRCIYQFRGIEKCTEEQLLLLKRLEYRSWMFVDADEKRREQSTFELFFTNVDVIPEDDTAFDEQGYEAYVDFAKYMGRKVSWEDAEGESESEGDSMDRTCTDEEAAK